MSVRRSSAMRAGLWKKCNQFGGPQARADFRTLNSGHNFQKLFVTTPLLRSSHARNRRQPNCSFAAMLSRLKRLELSVTEMVVLAIVVGLLTALFPVSVS